MKKQLPFIISILFILIFSIACDTKNTTNPDSKLEITFTEVTNHHPALDSLYSQAVAAIDLNNDYYPELYVTNSWTGSRNHFYLNSAGVFIKDTTQIFAIDNEHSNGCSFVDIDNDGFLDLCIANFDNQPNCVYYGKRDGTFEKEKIQPELTESWSYGVAFADIDNNGTLELYISNYKQQRNNFYSANNRLFTAIDTSIITQNLASSINSAWSDLNNDGLQDLIVCNDSVNQLFQNLGDYNFKLIQSDLTKDTSSTYGCSIADFNNDGLMDVFVVNFIGKNWVYKNKGDFKFEKIKTPFTSDYNFSEGSCWGDYNNDGYIDLCVTNDGANILYKNILGFAFEKQVIGGFEDSTRNSNGIVWMDYDLDGDLDLFVANGGNQRNQLFENSGNDNNWVKIKLEGTTSNKSAIGARVIVYSGDLVQHQEVQSQSGGGCGSQKQLLLHYGLGQNTKIDSIQIKWPSTPMSTELNINCNSIYTFKE